MDLNKLEQDINAIVRHLNKDSFIYQFLLSYDFPKATITRLQKGLLNKSKNKDDVNQEILWKNLFFRVEDQQDLHLTIDEAQKDPVILKQHPRFIIVTDFKRLLAVDTKVDDSLDILLTELSENYAFFLPWAEMEKTQIQSLNLVDIKAAKKLDQLYDIIIQENHIESESERHGLNIFLSRLLFCFFAEDLGIFEDNQFTNAVASHTSNDGSDCQDYLIALFKVLNVKKRSDEPTHLKAFPYVNGGVFAEDHPAPKLNAKARKIILDSGALNWKQITPDIFGSMMQAVVHSDQRGSLGMHYTSVANIMKVIEPLFLNDLKQQLDNAGNNENKLIKLLDRLYHLRLFDPACGSGNFLIIAYKELCKLEIEAFKTLQEVNPTKWLVADGIAISGIQLTQFYGIELSEFAHETAKLSLWLAEHQMNLAFKAVFGSAKPALPLQDGGHIVCGNAARENWEDVCPKEKGAEIYIMGNPPYIGSKNQDKIHKEDMKLTASRLRGYGILDYVSLWFIKATDYILESENIKYAFVSTSSITQGEQVSVLWPYLLEHNLEIFFAVLPFNWSNNAKGNASVHCVIIGLGIRIKEKYISDAGRNKHVKKISPYLIEGEITFVKKRRKPLSNVPKMGIGNKPIDDGNYLFTDAEKIEFIKKESESEKYFYRWYGGREFSVGLVRWCILPQRIPDDVLKNMPEVRKLIRNVKLFRSESKSKPTNKLALTPKNFHVENFPSSNYMVIQKVSTGIREYLPVGLFDTDSISSDLLNVIASSDLSVFAVVSSQMHMIWTGTVCGRFGDGFRYSSGLCYNTFPFPDICETQKIILEDHVFNVLDEREKHPEKTMAELYDPDKMPDGLRQAHHEMDRTVEQCYRKKPFKSDEERLEYLFKLYEEMIEREKNNG